VVTLGRACPEGFLPVYSVGSEEEAHRLLVLCCPRDNNGNFIARELAQEQTLERLSAFSDRLHAGHSLLVKSGECDCCRPAQEVRNVRG
jgi:hypothetical protein